MKNIIYKIILKLTKKNYKNPFRRKIHKLFFKFLQIILLKKYHFNNLEKLDANYQKFKISGFVIIDKLLLNDQTKFKIDNSIFLAKNIFENENKIYIKKNKAYLKGVDFLNTPNAGKLFYELFTDDYFLKIAKNYLNDTPLLTEIKLLHSPITHDNIYNGSQLLHSDHDDDKLMKIFIYLNDVTIESGPLEIVNKNITEEIIKISHYRWGQEHRQYKSHDDKLLNLYPNSNQITSLIGNEGTVIIADTANCLHRGSRNPNKERLVLYATYTTRTSFSHPPINWFWPTNAALLISSPLMNLDIKKNWLGDLAINK
jgi:hypothetical protein